MSNACTVVVLAAGKGSRFRADSHKLAAPFGDSGVLATTLRQAIASQLHVVVVTTPPFAELARQIIASRDVVLLPARTSGEGLDLSRLGEDIRR